MNHFERPTTNKQEFPVVRRLLFLFGLVFIALLAGSLGFVLTARWFIITPVSTDTTSLLATSYPKVNPAGNVAPVLFTKLQDYVATILYSSADTTGALLPDSASFVGPAVVLTSDGWFATSARPRSAKSYFIVMNNKTYPLSEVVYDSYTGVTFVKATVQNLNPVDFTVDYIAMGQQLFLERGSYGSSVPFDIAYCVKNPFAVQDTNDDYYLQSSAMNFYIEPELLSAKPGTGIYFDDAGRFVGMGIQKNSYSLIIYGEQIRLSFEALLRGTINSDLGIRYVDNSRVINPRGSIADGITIDSLGSPAVVPGSRAAAAGLKKGDIILAIAGDRLDQYTPFDLLWRRHQHDQTIEITVMRDQKQMGLTVLP